MIELVDKIAFLEARITLLERQILTISETRYPNSSNVAASIDRLEPIEIACDDGNLAISGAYPTEWNPDGKKFCWIGNDGPIQFIVPVEPLMPLDCVLHLRPHHAVELSGLSVWVSNAPTMYKIIDDANDRSISLSIDVPPRPTPNFSIQLIGINSVRPVDLGESSDVRFLAAQFFGASIRYKNPAAL